MKIKPEHLEHLRTAIAPLDTENTRNIYRNGGFPQADKTKDLNKRYRWDLLNAAVPSRWIIDNLYPYSHDEHIDTALRSIVKEL